MLGGMNKLCPGWQGHSCFPHARLFPDRKVGQSYKGAPLRLGSQAHHSREKKKSSFFLLGLESTRQALKRNQIQSDIENLREPVDTGKGQG